MMDFNQCHYYALLENKLLRTSAGEIDYLLMDRKGKKFLVETKAYLTEVYKHKCQSLGQISQIFTIDTLKKTIGSLNLAVPKTKEDCNAIFSDWKKNDYLPYLCAIPQQLALGKKSQIIKNTQSNRPVGLTRKLNENIRVGERLEKDLTFFERSYLTNLCSGFENQDNFCSPYLTTNAWNRIVSGEIPSYYLDYKCRNLFKKDSIKDLSKNNIMSCAKKLKDDPKLCTTKSTAGFSSIFPRPNCSLIARGINESHLNVNHYDCPGQIDNAAITNLHRILYHFYPVDTISSPSSCKAEANYTFKELLDKSKNATNWPLQICYMDKIENKEMCHDYIPGALPGVTSSENIVVTKILKRMNKISSSQKCTVVSAQKFNPILLEYKNGCFIVFNEKKCSDAFCDRKIIIDEQKIEGLKYVGKTKFDYVPNNWRNQNKSATKLIEEVFKIKSKQIRNLTELEVFLRQKSDGIIHGIGCAEDILPRYFKRKSFNFCTPLPFILDGLVNIDNNKVLVTRTAIDDLHSPRLIPWNWLFTAIMKYQARHPLNQWNLYGLSL